MGALRRDLRATETEPRKSGGRTRDPEGERGKSRNAMWAGRRRENRRGRRWRKLERTGRKEGEGKGRKPEETEEEAEENVTEPATGKTQTEAEYYPEEIRAEGEERLELEAAWGTKWREPDARKGTKRRETRANEGGEIRGGSCIGPWRRMVRIARKGNGEREEGGDPLGERR